ncbi:MAG: porin family protein [Candidatus Saccharicenans sp.]
MKKATVVFLALFLIIFFTQEAQALVTFGVKGGINNSKVTFSPGITDFLNQKYLQTYSAGIFLTVNLGPIGFQPEVLYSRRGLQYEFQFDPSEPVSQVKILMDYIEIPLLVRLNIIPAGPVKAYVFAGPSYGYLQKAKMRITLSGNTTTEDIKDDLKSSVLAAVAGIGLDIKIPLLFKVTVDARYHYGLSNILSANSTLLDLTNKARNTGYSFMVGIGF